MKKPSLPFIFGFVWIAVCLLALALRAYLYVEGARSIPVTTDEALTVLQALDIRAGDFPLLLAAQPYMFPLEAYWMAPWVEWLPRTALGMRSLVVIEGLVFVGLLLLLLRQRGGWRSVWPGLLLALFPSVYLLMNQTAYSQPHNNSAFILALAAAWFVMRLNREPRCGDFILAVAGGFFAALAFSNAILSLALIAPLAVVAAWNSAGKGRWLRLPGHAIGGFAGLLPYLIAIWKIPGAHGSVTATFGWSDALPRLWMPALARTLPVTFGFRPCLFPDSAARLEWGEWGHAIFPHVLVLLLVAAAGLALVQLWRGFRAARPLFLGAMEWALGVSVLSLLLFALSKRADSSAYRYLVPMVVVFPLLMAGLHQAAGPRLRWLTGGLALVLAAYNAAVSVRLPREWRHPDFARDIVAAPDLGPALDVLRQRGIRHAVASHWAAYRIGFEADGAVLCSQPQNERFPGWAIPYKTEVDASTNVAYVLTEGIRFLKPSVFERHLRTMGVEAEVTEAGDFRVYSHFRAPTFEREARVAPERVRIDASENPEWAMRMMDGDTGTFWRSAALQREGIRLEFAFDRPLHLGRLILGYGGYAHDRAPALRVQVLNEAGWETLHEALKPEMDKFAWRNGHPTYGHAQQTISFGGISAQALRVEIAQPNPAMCWTVAEAMVYEGPSAE